MIGPDEDDGSGRPLLRYQAPAETDPPEQRLAAIVFVVGILVCVLIGMGLVIRFVIFSTF